METVSDELRDSWRQAAHPGELFVRLWLIACRWTAADRGAVPVATPAIERELADAVDQPDGSVVVSAVTAILDAAWPSGTSHRDCVNAAMLILTAMRAIEAAYTPLHPRTRTWAPSIAPTATRHNWIDDAEAFRLRNGSFAEVDEHRLIPNGPFARHARGRDASSADLLQDYFPTLTVAPAFSKAADCRLAIDIKVIGTDAMRGVPASRSIGCERIQFIPLAEDADDLKFETHDRDGHPVLDVVPSVDTSARLVQALRSFNNIDVAFAPELTVAWAAEPAIQNGILQLGDGAPRITLAGTGLTSEAGPCGRHWNEARVFGKGGHLLWCQRKFWPYGMQQAAALDYGFDDPGANNMLMENVAGSTTINVVDLDGFGRCVILICQDLQAQPVVDEVLARYQPDWVLTPVLDPGVKKVGWARQRAEALSKKAQSRFLVGSSLTLSYRRAANGAEPPIGLALGPAEPTQGPMGGGELQRAIAVVSVTAGSSPKSALLEWNHRLTYWSEINVT